MLLILFSSIRSAGTIKEWLYLLGQQAILVTAPVFLEVLPKVSKGIGLQQVVPGTAAEHKLGTDVLTG